MAGIVGMGRSSDFSIKQLHKGTAEIGLKFNKGQEKSDPFGSSVR